MKQRIITGVIAGVFFLGMLALGGFWYSALILLLAVIGYNEYMKMSNLLQNKAAYIIGLIPLVLLVIPWTEFNLQVDLFSFRTIWLGLFLLMALTVILKNKFNVDQAAYVFLGVLYIAFGFHFMIETRLLANGLFWTMLVFVCIWASDAGAYFVGSKIGKTPLWPAISPNKSIEGAVGGVIISVIAAVIFSLWKPELISVVQAILLGIMIAIVGQFGDLIQSAYKRVKGIKDTGTLLPGHGGVLDRVDSWLIVFPFVHLLSMIPN